MAKNIFGNLTPFDPKVCRFSVYVDRFKQILAFNEIEPPKDVGLFIIALGDAHFELLTNLLAPTKPETLKLDELIKVLQDHFDPAVNELAERYRFRSRTQKEGEDLTSYFSHLKQLSLNCNYDTTLDDTLKEQFIIGIRDDYIKKKLVMEASGKKVEQIFVLAKQQETLDHEIPTFHSNTAASINQVKSSGKQQKVSNETEENHSKGAVAVENTSSYHQNREKGTYQSSRGRGRGNQHGIHTLIINAIQTEIKHNQQASVTDAEKIIGNNHVDLSIPNVTISVKLVILPEFVNPVALVA